MARFISLPQSLKLKFAPNHPDEAGMNGTKKNVVDSTNSNQQSIPDSNGLIGGIIRIRAPGIYKHYTANTYTSESSVSQLALPVYWRCVRARAHARWFSIYNKQPMVEIGKQAHAFVLYVQSTICNSSIASQSDALRMQVARLKCRQIETEKWIQSIRRSSGSVVVVVIAWIAASLLWERF